MAYLEIDGKQYEAKVNFKFEKKANEKYKEKTKDKDIEVSGLETIYENLLNYKTSALLSFWDCALAYLKKDAPSVEKIEEALEKIIEEEGTDRLFQEAFQTLDNSGFFKKQLESFWKNLDLVDKLSKTEEEKNQAQILKEMYKEKRKELNPNL